jgi:hypothetical protein
MRGLASGSCSIVFLLLETLSGACAGYVVSLELAEKLEDLIVGQKGGVCVQDLWEMIRKRETSGRTKADLHELMTEKGKFECATKGGTPPSSLALNSLFSFPRRHQKIQFVSTEYESTRYSFVPWLRLWSYH